MLPLTMNMNMSKITTRSDAFGFLMVSEIADELETFSKILNVKYQHLDFYFDVCFRALYTLIGIRSKVRFDKEDNCLGFDLMMLEEEFLPYKRNKSMQRLIMGRYFFPFFCDKLRRYKKKLSTLEPVLEDLIEDMRLFLIEHLWLPDEDGCLRLSVIENYTYEQTMAQFGPPNLKTFADVDDVKEQDLRWDIDENISLSAQYKLIDRVWRLKWWKVSNPTQEASCK